MKKRNKATWVTNYATDDEPSAAELSCSTGRCLVVRCPDWFERPDFLTFLNGHRTNQGPHGNWPIASWHKPGDQDTPATEMSDTFITYDGGDLSEQDSLPEDICESLKWLWQDRFGKSKPTWGVIWLQNLDRDGGDDQYYTCHNCFTPQAEGGDGYDGLCENCADKLAGGD